MLRLHLRNLGANLTNYKFPTSSTLEQSTLNALKSLDGQATNHQILEYVMKDLKLDPTIIEIKRSGNRSELEYRLAWVRTKAKKKGLISRADNKQWKLTL